MQWRKADTGGDAMTDKPILFNAPMVQALLGGRKTQTRRVLAEKYRGVLIPAHSVSNGQSGPIAHEYDRTWPVRTGYAVGDRLWARETWGMNHYQFMNGPIPKARPDELEDRHLSYRATEDDCEIQHGLRYWPSSNMPRWASRITLTVTDVRVERLQDISEADVHAEGLRISEPRQMMMYGMDAQERTEYRKLHAQDRFKTLWNDINGPGSWEANPWIVALTFDVALRNIDEVTL